MIRQRRCDEKEISDEEKLTTQQFKTLTAIAVYLNLTSIPELLRLKLN